MKLKTTSLMWKLFFTFLIFASAIVLVFIIFQIALLGDFYRTNKFNRTNQLIYDVSDAIENQDIQDFTQNESLLLKNLEKISIDEEAAIYLYAKPYSSSIVGATNDTLIYKTISGGTFSKLDSNLIDEIWEKAKSTTYDKFYAIISVNPVPTFNQIQILDVNSSVRNLTRDLSSQNDSIMCCSFVRLSDGDEYLLVLDNKIIPVESAVATLKLQLTYIAFIVVVFTIVVAILISRYISKPLSVMNETAKLMAKGNYDVVFEGKGYQEVNELNQTLNNTIAELRKTETLRRELMANVSHDLRTPLTMIKGYAEMMQDIPGENNPENLQIIIDEVNRLNVLVNDMLDLSKISSKTIELHPQLYSITDNLIEIVDRYQKFQENNEFQFILNYDQNINVIADESKIDQVIYNFINNAINYSGNSKKIEINQIVDGSYVTISVRDYGVGIKKEDLVCIWDRYYRIDKGHKRSIQGSGLGLSIVKGILEYHNFEYGVDSKVGEGSTFWFKIPLKE